MKRVKTRNGPIIAGSASWTPFLATAVSLCTLSSIHFSLSLLLKMGVSHHFNAEGFLSDRKLCNAPKAGTIPASKPQLPTSTWWRCHVDRFIDLLYSPAGRGEMLISGTLNIVSWVDSVVARDVGCCKIWTTSRQAVSLMSRLVCFINLNKAKSALWQSLRCT